MRYTAFLIITGLALTASPALAHRDRGPAPQDDSNSYWLDYRTDLSEARRELRSDLADATDDEDRRDAHEEYRQEVADARADYVKEMREKGYRVGMVIVEGD